MNFTAPPAHQGQIVEVAYALTPEGIVERTTDHSDGTVVYRVASWTRTAEQWATSEGPQTSAPPVRRWRRATSAEVQS